MKLTLACLLILALVAGAACTQVVEAPPETALPPVTTPATQAPATTPPPATTTPTEEPEATPPAATTEGGITEEDIEAARQAVFAYREAFNNYDVEGALAFLEESHRADREDGIRSDIGQMKAYGIKLGVEEEAEPTITDDGMVAIYIKLDVPVFGQKDRHVIYYLMEIEGEWKICVSEDVE
jgi:hypothetical protein